MTWNVLFVALTPRLRLSERSPFGPNALLQIERSLTVLDRAGLDVSTTLQILMTFDNYVTGSVLNELREIRVEQAQSGVALASAEIVEGMRDWRERMNRSGMFTHVKQIFDGGIDPDAAETRENRSEFGLNCVLDGIAVHLLKT